ncbi:hypothetical protein GCM10010123_21080 [Pilimelia anulata]|uniref:Uncharacterized protein n=1 Tax=Pilimelia anulata TaxID=53371 RepID=A0A8J3B3M3_9ACTN|nr:hypothetical protein [Pilimelia anulata]GGJ90972.1 hypothetical protein GCM10010123_21080 [Pilimelia anulata]
MRTLAAGWPGAVLVSLVVPGLPTALAYLPLLRYFGTGGTGALPDRPLLPDDPLPLLVAGLAPPIVLALTYPLGFAAIARVLVLRAAGEPAPVGAALRYAVRRLPGLLGPCLAAGLLVGLGALLCLLPGLVVLFVLSLVPAVALFERRRSLRRSAALVGRRWDAVLLGCVLAGPGFVPVVAGLLTCYAEARAGEAPLSTATLRAELG